MKKRNITLTLPPKTMEIIDNLYEAGVINSRTQIIEMALFDYLSRNGYFQNNAENTKSEQRDYCKVCGVEIGLGYNCEGYCPSCHPKLNNTNSTPEYEKLKFYPIGDEIIDGWLDKANERIKIALTKSVMEEKDD